MAIDASERRINSTVGRDIGCCPGRDDRQAALREL